MKTKTLSIYIAAMSGIGMLTPTTNWADTRTWTDQSGEHKIEAEFVSVEGGKVQLKTPEGRVISLPLSRLNESDRALARRLGGLDPYSVETLLHEFVRYPKKFEANYTGKAITVRGKLARVLNAPADAPDVLELEHGLRLEFDPKDRITLDHLKKLADRFGRSKPPLDFRLRSPADVRKKVRVYEYTVTVTGVYRGPRTGRIILSDCKDLSFTSEELKAE